MLSCSFWTAAFLLHRVRLRISSRTWSYGFSEVLRQACTRLIWYGVGYYLNIILLICLLICIFFCFYIHFNHQCVCAICWITRCISVCIFVALESVGAKHRVRATFIIEAMFSLGGLLIVATAYFTRDWRIVELVCGVPLVMFASCYWYLHFA